MKKTVPVKRAESTDKPTRKTSFLNKLENHPIISILIVIAIAVGGVTAFTKNLQEIWSTTRVFFLNKNEYPAVVIHGIIRDTDFKPIEGVRITIDGEHFETLSRNDGTFMGNLTNIPKGELINLRISHNHYKTRIVDKIISSEKEYFEIILIK